MHHKKNIKEGFIIFSWVRVPIAIMSDPLSFAKEIDASRVKPRLPLSVFFRHPYWIIILANKD